MRCRRERGYPISHLGSRVTKHKDDDAGRGARDMDRTALSGGEGGSGGEEGRRGGRERERERMGEREIWRQNERLDEAGTVRKKAKEIERQKDEGGRE